MSFPIDSIALVSYKNFAAAVLTSVFFLIMVERVLKFVKHVSKDPSRHYLWTNSFAVIGLVFDGKFDLASQLISRTHKVLGTHSSGNSLSVAGISGGLRLVHTFFFFSPRHSIFLMFVFVSRNVYAEVFFQNVSVPKN